MLLGDVIGAACSDLSQNMNTDRKRTAPKAARTEKSTEGKTGKYVSLIANKCNILMGRGYFLTENSKKKTGILYCSPPFTLVLSKVLALPAVNDIAFI